MSFTIDDENYLNYNKKRIVFPDKETALFNLSKNQIKKNIIIFYIENENDNETFLIYKYVNNELVGQIHPYPTISKQSVKNIYYYKNTDTETYVGGFLNNEMKLYLVKSIEKYVKKNPQIIKKIIPSNRLVKIFNNDEYDKTENIKIVVEYIRNIEPVFELIIKIKNKTSIPLKNIIFTLFIVINSKKSSDFDIDDNFFYTFLNIIYPSLEKYIYKKITQK
jgi:hypothetical protein